MTNKPDTALTAAQERAAVVAWLLSDIDRTDWQKPARLVVLKLARRIERGDHNGEGK